MVAKKPGKKPGKVVKKAAAPAKKPGKPVAKKPGKPVAKKLTKPPTKVVLKKPGKPVTKKAAAKTPKEPKNEYRKLRKWTIAKLEPFLHEDMVSAIRGRIGANHAATRGPLLASELLQYLRKLEKDTPDWRQRGNGAEKKAAKKNAVKAAPAAKKPGAPLKAPKPAAATDILKNAAAGGLLGKKPTAAPAKPGAPVARPGVPLKLPTPLNGKPPVLARPGKPVAAAPN
jgi:hypothetical protein